MTGRKPRFIWLPNQRVDHLSMFMTIHGAPLRREDEGENRWVLARGWFDAADDVDEARLAITVDGRYRLWVNGVRIGNGPVRSNPAYQRVDSHDITREIHIGRNCIAVLIHVPGRDLAWYETVKGGWQPVFGDGALHVETRLDHGGATTTNIADGAWRIVESDAWARDAQLAGWGQDFLEDVDGCRLDPAWTTRDFDDSGWPHARAMRAEPNEEVRARGWSSVEPFRTLIATRKLPAHDAAAYPSHLCWVRAVVPQTDLSLKTRLYAEALEGGGDACAETAHALIGGEGPATLRTQPGRDTALLFAFDPYQVGRPFIDFTAHGGEIVEIAVSEALPGEFGRGIEGDGLRNEGKLWVSHILRYKARPGRQRFEKFNSAGVRALQLVLRNAPKPVVVHELGVMATHYPAQPGGRFECSDELLVKLWNVGRHTLLMCAQDGWVDCPGRESRQWLGDGIVMFDMAALAFGPSIFALHREFLQQVAEGQRSDGLARMVSPGDLVAGAVTIPDYSLLWIIGTWRYFLATGDLDLVDSTMAAIEQALGWFERARDASGLIADVPEWHFIEWADVGREGHALPFNALYAGALAAATALAGACGRPRLATRYRRDRDIVAAALNRGHWDEARGVYVDCVDPDSGVQGLRVSQHGNALALLFDIAPVDRRDRILAAITDRSRLRLTDAPPIMTNAGLFDDEHDIVRANSFFAHFVYDGIARAGRVDWVIDDLRDGFGPMIQAGATTLWESFEPIASLCHGFSATPVYQLSRHVLGVEALAPAFARFAVRPIAGTLDWATGVVPTPHGPIDIDWQIVDGAMVVDIAYPEECTLELAADLAARVTLRDQADGRIGLRFVADQASVVRGPAASEAGAA